MNSDDRHIEYLDLITKKLSGEITTDEDHKLQKWLEDSHENQQVFNSYKATWDEMDRVKDKTSRDVDAEWKRLEGTIDFEESTGSVRQRYVMPKTLRYAAAVLALVVSIITVYNIFQNQGEQQLVAQVQIQNGSSNINLLCEIMITFAKS